MLRREASTRIGLRTDCRCRELPIRRTLLMPGTRAPAPIHATRARLQPSRAPPARSSFHVASLGVVYPLRTTAGVSDDLPQTPSWTTSRSLGREFCSPTETGACGTSRAVPAMRATIHVDGKAIRSSRRVRRGRWLLVEGDHWDSGRTPMSSSRVAWRRRRRPVPLLKARAWPDGRPGGAGVRSATLRTVTRRSTVAAGLRSPFARGCGRRHAPGRRARVSSAASVSSSLTETLGTTHGTGSGASSGEPPGAGTCSLLTRSCDGETVADGTSVSIRGGHRTRRTAGRLGDALLTVSGELSGLFPERGPDSCRSLFAFRDVRLSPGSAVPAPASTCSVGLRA